MLKKASFNVFLTRISSLKTGICVAMVLASSLASLHGVAQSLPPIPSNETNRFQDIETLRLEVLAFAEDLVINQSRQSTNDKDIKVEVGSLDSRLKLTRCAESLTHKSKAQSYSSNNITVQTSCYTGKKRLWSIYVPVKVSVFIEVVILNTNLARGDILTINDLNLRKVNTSGLSSTHITDINKAVGKELKRSVKSGMAVRLSYLSEVDVIKRGDAVTLAAKSAFLSVDTIATALSDGHIGQTIKVRNSQSKRVVDAQVTGPGKVQIVGR